VARRKGYRQSKAKEKEYNARSYAKAKAWLYALKSHPCTDCRQVFPPVCMQFDHVPERGEKLFEINLARYTRKHELLLLELAKCDLVCANCHCIRTALRRAN